jgi:hypothetical protein
MKAITVYVTTSPRRETSIRVRDISGKPGWTVVPATMRWKTVRALARVWARRGE